jgi:hypothetical protein
MPHPDEGLIHAWLDGELEPSEASRVEALVATDPVWSAAAAEARGLIAASSRVVNALDRVPANVVPAAHRKPRRASWWLSRVAALLVVVVGASIVSRRDPTVQTVIPTSPAPKAVAMTAPPVASSPAVSEKMKTGIALVTPTASGAQAPAPRAASPTLAAAENRVTALLDAPSREAVPLKKTVEDSVVARREQLQGRALQLSAAPAAPRAARPAAHAALGEIREDAAKSAAAERCFVARAPKADSTAIVRLGPTALADSIRAGWEFLADSLLARPNGRPMLHQVPCPVR